MNKKELQAVVDKMKPDEEVFALIFSNEDVDEHFIADDKPCPPKQKVYEALRIWHKNFGCQFGNDAMKDEFHSFCDGIAQK